MKKIKKILIISHYFPPIKNVQSKINLSTCLAFLKWGITPLVLTTNAKHYDKDLSFEKFLNNIEIEHYNSYIKTSFMDKVRGFLGIPPQRNIFGGIWKEIFYRAENIVLREKIDAIYSISAPGDSHFAAMKLANKYQLFWIAEFQDPWVNNITFDAWARENMNFLYRNIFYKIVHKSLVKILNRADIILTESKSHADLLKKIAQRYSFNTSKVNTCYLGVDPNILCIKEDTVLSNLLSMLKDKVIIGFIGNVYFGYEERVRSFINFLKGIDDKNFIFLFVGSSFITPLINELKFKNAICIEQVPYSKALSFISKLDWGVVIPSSHMNINSKAFDYLACNVPILVWGEENDEMVRLVEQNRWGIHITINQDNKIGELLKRKKLNFKPNTNFYREKCMEPLKKIIFS